MTEKLFDFTNVPLNIAGYLPDGRPIVRNPDGSVSTHRNTIVNFDKDWYVIPTMYGGKQVSTDEAVNIIKSNKFVDPDTGKTIPKYSSLEEAEKHEDSGHAFLSEVARMLSR